MKKFFLLAVAVTAMLAACSKTEITPIGEAQEIAFTAVNKTATRVPVADNNFLDYDNMAIAAYIVEGASKSGNFFEYTWFTKNSNNLWSGKPARYWPLTTSTINFLAVTENGGNVDNTTVTFDANDYTASATAVLKGNAALNQNDLMFAAGTGTHTQGGEYNAVPMVFKHALAWINFKVATTTPAAAENEGCTITVNSITLNEAVYDGTLILKNKQYNSTTPNTTDEIEPTWDLENKVNSLSVPSADGKNLATAVTLSQTAQLFGNGLLVVPDGYATSFTINYTLTQNGGTANTFDYTYKLPEPPTGKTTAWEMANKYFYNINISLTEIEVTPSVAAWDDQGKPTPINGYDKQ